MKNTTKVTLFLIAMFFLVIVVWPKEEPVSKDDIQEQIQDSIQNDVTRSEWEIQAQNTIIEDEVISQKENSYELREVVDWDTVRMYNVSDKKVKAYRLVWIDAPENTSLRYGYTEKYGDQAKEYLKELLDNKILSIEYDETQWKQDKYDRELVFLFADDINVWEQMIAAWYAKEFTYNKVYKYQSLYREAQARARDQKLWIWNMQKIESNTEKSKAAVALTSDKFVDQENPRWECVIKWNINSDWVKIYHYPGCQSYTKTKISENRGEQYFCSEQEALAAGWRVAGNC